MIEVFLEVLKRITIFMVIGKVILNLGMGKGYEKYTKMVIGFMVVVQLWAGFNSTFYLLKREKTERTQATFFSAWEEEMKAFEEELRTQQKEIENTWKEYDGEGKEKELEKEESGIKIEQITIGEETEDEE